MYNLIISDSDFGRTLTITGDVTIQNASALKEQLQELRKSGMNAAINLDGLQEADLACLQLLCSAHHTFTANNQMFTITGRYPEPLKKTILATGYQRDRGCPLDATQTCLWVGRIEQ